MNRFEIGSFRILRRYVASDLYRYFTNTNFKSFVRGWFIPGFRYTFFMRATRYFASKGPLFKPFYFLNRVMLRHYSFKYGFQIPWQTPIGPGLYIAHFGTIIVNPSSTIGINCNLSPGVLFGLTHRVDENGRSLGFEYPSIGNRVYLGNNAKLLGGVTVGDDATVGAGAIVTHPVEPRAVVAGNPARKLSEEGSAAYIGSLHPWTLTFDESDRQGVVVGSDV